VDRRIFNRYGLQRIISSLTYLSWGGGYYNVFLDL
jgi:hypothetical protein